ncbi:MAG: hypothetical protein IKO68_01665 [Oscillospiraceae bacterium]|nr:hypothetical protein [Oscillospiraceae bacterium]
MEFNVRLLLDGRQLDPADYAKVAISCRDIDMIVNHIYELNHPEKDEPSKPGSTTRRGPEPAYSQQAVRGAYHQQVFFTVCL